jgi:hypothetical protein
MSIPRPGRKLRWLVILCGLAIFLWMGPEDNHIWPVTLLGTLSALLVVIYWTLRALGGKVVPRRYVPPLATLLGALVGLGASVSTALMMFFKNVWHAHLFPDFPAALIGAMLERAPAWTLAGGLAGLGLGLIWLTMHTAGSTGTTRTTDTELHSDKEDDNGTSHRGPSA